MSVKMQLPLPLINYFCYCSFAFLVYCCVGKTPSVSAIVPIALYCSCHEALNQQV